MWIESSLSIPNNTKNSNNNFNIIYELTPIIGQMMKLDEFMKFITITPNKIFHTVYCTNHDSHVIKSLLLREFGTMMYDRNDTWIRVIRKRKQSISSLRYLRRIRDESIETIYDNAYYYVKTLWKFIYMIYYSKSHDIRLALDTIHYSPNIRVTDSTINMVLVNAIESGETFESIESQNIIDPVLTKWNNILNTIRLTHDVL